MADGTRPGGGLLAQLPPWAWAVLGVVALGLMIPAETEIEGAHQTKPSDPEPIKRRRHVRLIR